MCAGWGDTTHAVRSLLRTALLEPRNQRFMLLSDADIPLYPATLTYLQLFQVLWCALYAASGASDLQSKVRRRTRSGWRPAQSSSTQTCVGTAARWPLRAACSPGTGASEPCFAAMCPCACADCMPLAGLRCGCQCPDTMQSSSWRRSQCAACSSGTAATSSMTHSMAGRCGKPDRAVS